MPVSARPEAEAPGETEAGLELLDRLETAVQRLLDSLGSVRERAERAEAAYEKLRAALETTEGEGDGPADLEERLENLAEENRRLRETIRTAKERAERIRSRLMVVEDEL